MPCAGESRPIWSAKGYALIWVKPQEISNPAMEHHRTLFMEHLPLFSYARWPWLQLSCRTWSLPHDLRGVLLRWDPGWLPSPWALFLSSSFNSTGSSDLNGTMAVSRLGTGHLLEAVGTPVDIPVIPLLYASTLLCRSVWLLAQQLRGRLWLETGSDRQADTYNLWARSIRGN